LTISCYCEWFFTQKTCTEYQNQAKQLVHESKGAAKVLKEGTVDESIAKNLVDKLSRVLSKLEDSQRRNEKSAALLKDAHMHFPEIRILHLHRQPI
jgi:hypothetical protein